MNNTFSVICVLLLATSHGCKSGAPVTKPTPSTTQTTLLIPATPASAESQPLGERVSNVILHADQVVACSIDHVGGDISHDVFPHRQLGTTIVVNDTLKRELSATLTDAATYDLGTQIICFEPGVHYEFRSGADVVTVEVCFNCQMLSVELNRDNNSEGRHLVCFIPGYNHLLKLTRKVFVLDKNIQSIGEK